MAEASRAVLRRGRSCAYCRRRKRKCDGQKPICGPCLQASREDDCEYLDSHGRSKADILEEDIVRLESRIHELERPQEAAASSVSLRNPYQQRVAQMPSTVRVLESSRTPGNDIWWNSLEPPPSMVETFLDIFLPYAADWGFFLDTSLFRSAALLPLPLGHHSRPSPALLAAVYLVAIALSGIPDLTAHEKTFLSRALAALPASLSGLHPRKVLHALQAEVLLSNYFYATGKFLEGRYHTTAAASLVVSSGLLGTSNAGAAVATMEGTDPERLDACWAVILLDKMWAVALATNPNLQDSPEIQRMEWPGQDTLALSTRSTVSQFLENLEPAVASSGVASSTKTLLAKATVLWERANSLAASWNPDMRPREVDEVSRTFTALDARIDAFLVGVLHRGTPRARGKQRERPEPGANVDMTSDTAAQRGAILARTIAQAAVLRLHNHFPRTRRRRFEAARAILALAAEIEATASTFVPPIFAPIWASALAVVADELSSARMERTDDGGPTQPAVELEDVFARGMSAMRSFERWAVMSQYLQKVEGSFRM